MRMMLYPVLMSQRGCLHYYTTGYQFSLNLLTLRKSMHKLAICAISIPLYRTGTKFGGCAQVLNKLREVEVLISQGATTMEASRKIGITEQTYYRWRREYGGMRMALPDSKKILPGF